MKPILQTHRVAQRVALASLVCCALAISAAHAATPAPTKPASADVSTASARIGPTVQAIVGKSTLIRLPDAVERISVGNPTVADVTLISPREIYLLGKDLGATNLIVWAKDAPTTVVEVQVGADAAQLEAELRTVLATETDIKVKTSADSIVLMGTVSDSIKAAYAVQVAEAWIRRLTRGLIMPVTIGDKGGTSIQVGEKSGVTQTAQVAGPRIINMLQVRDPQQVMLEVKVAEVSKTLLDKLGVTMRLNTTPGGFNVDFLSQSNFLGQLLGAAAISKGANDFAQIDAQRDDGLVKMLAEPNIMAISGQEASFRAGGKIFIPVASTPDQTGFVRIQLEEREFGVGVKFKPTVLEGGRINLKVSPEVSELQQTGTPFTTVGGVTSVLPSFTLRRAETTVQLYDGQSFMIAGLIKNDVSQTVNRFPGLGELPIIGALFRSSEFQSDKTELMFIITPRLVKPLAPDYALPTDGLVEPTREEFFFKGKMEGEAAAPPSRAQPARANPAVRNAGGFEVK